MTCRMSRVKDEERRVVAQLKSESGEPLGSTFDLPLSVTAATLQQICNALLQQVIVMQQLLLLLECEVVKDRQVFKL